MLRHILYLCLILPVVVNFVEGESQVITFTLLYQNKKLQCDHTSTLKSYTALEGEEFKINIKYKKFIHELLCQNQLNREDIKYEDRLDQKDHKTYTFVATSYMDTVWVCTVLTLRYTTIEPRLTYKEVSYAFANCSMQLHIRRKESRQTMLVNGMVLRATRADLSQEVDFVAEYEYEDHDLVNVTCFLEGSTSPDTANSNKPKNLEMEYAMLDNLSDKIRNTKLQSDLAVGFVTRLHSEHHNTHTTCKYTDKGYYSSIQLKFIKQSTESIIGISINGLNLRPIVTKPENNYYELQYTYISDTQIVMVCKTQRKNDTVKLIVLDWDKLRNTSGFDYRQSNSTTEYKIEMTFINKKIRVIECAAGREGEEYLQTIQVRFVQGDMLSDPYRIHVELPADGIVMELYEHRNRTIILYDFEVEETLELRCYSLFSFINPKKPQPPYYIQFSDSNDNFFNATPTNVSLLRRTLHFNESYDNFEISCYLKEKEEPQSTTPHKIHREVKVIFRKREQTTISPIIDTTLPTKTIYSTNNATSLLDPERSITADGQALTVPYLAAIGGGACVVITCISVFIFKLRKRNQSQRGPYNRNYENLQEPSETTIQHPPQWDTNYAVPLDRRIEENAYSEPCQPDMYSTPIPKNLRNKQNPNNSYAILDLKNKRKKVPNQSEDPIYSEVNINADCYAKVLPKSERGQRQENPYSNVANEPTYAEPAYSNAAIKPQEREYSNINNNLYANSPAQEYVEPAYCEPNKLRK